MNKLAAVGSVVLIAVSAFLAGRYTGKPTSQGSPKAKHILYYIGPMHPAYKSDKPGIAPDCGMRLEPVYADPEGATTAPVGTQVTQDTVNIDPHTQQLVGITTARVERCSTTRTV